MAKHEAEPHGMTASQAVTNLSEELPTILDDYAANRISKSKAEKLINQLGDVWDTESSGTDGFVLTNGENPVFSFSRTYLVQQAKRAAAACYLKNNPHQRDAFYKAVAQRATKLRQRMISEQKGIVFTRSYAPKAAREDLWDEAYLAVASKKLRNAPMENDGHIDDFTLEEVGVLDKPEVDTKDFDAYVEEQLEAAKESGCTNSKRLRAIIKRRKKVFAVDFDECSIPDLTPMEPKLKPGAMPCSSKPRRMSLEHLTWLRGHVEQMERLGMLKRSKNPVSGIPVFVVPKPHGKGLRMVAEFRAVNHRCLPSSLPMPLLS